MNYRTSTESASKISTDCLIVGVYKNNKLSIAAEDIDKNCDGFILKLLKNGDLLTGLGEHKIIHGVSNINAKRLLIVGLGDSDTFGLNELKKANEVLTAAIRNCKLKSIANYLTCLLYTSPSPRD